MVSKNYSLVDLDLPPAPKPLGVYRPLLIVERFAYVSGHGPVMQDGKLLTGRVGEDLGIEGGYAAARQVGLTILSTLKSNLGDLSRVSRVVKLLGFVNCTADFTEHPAVINGCSELFVEVFGAEWGVGVRSAIGTNVLPSNIPVEIEGMFELK